MPYLEIENLTKSFGKDTAKVNVLNGVSMSVNKGEMCTVLGQSGSGKSTLLNIIGGLDSADGGTLLVDGLNIAELTAEELAAYRRRYLGFVFQFYNLVQNLTALENVELALQICKDPLDAREVLTDVGLQDRMLIIPLHSHLKKRLIR